MSAIPTSWNAEVHRLWTSGDRNGAIQELLSLINQAGRARPRMIWRNSLIISSCLPTFGRPPTSSSKRSRFTPTTSSFCSISRVARSRTEDHDGAIAAAQKYAELGGSDPMIFDTLANVFATRRPVRGGQGRGRTCFGVEG